MSGHGADVPICMTVVMQCMCVTCGHVALCVGVYVCTHLAVYVSAFRALGSGGVTLVLASPHSIPLLGDTGHLLSDLDYRPYLEV